MMRKLSLVVPAYNEEENIRPFLQRVEEVFKDTKYRVECVIVNDGSADDTAAVAGDAVRGKDGKYSFDIACISFSRNFGKEAAILAGMENSSGEYVAIIDADLQQDPRYVLQMADFLEEHGEYDGVACYQDKRKEGFGQKAFKKLFYSTANRISDIKFEENASDFRTLRRYVVDAIVSMPEYNRFSKGLFSWVGFNTYYMPYEVNKRMHGETKWSFRKLTSYALDGFVGFSSSPLRASAWCGALIAAIAFIYMIYVAVKRLTLGVEVPGYATIVSLILIIGGLQMIFLGIIGEYIARMFMEVKNRPKYLIKEIIRSNEDGRNDKE